MPKAIATLPTTTRCLLCGSIATFGYPVEADRWRRAIAALLKDETISAIDIPDYRMFRCGACQLEFADPPVPGSGQLYDWLVDHEEYYPTNRWEWHIVRRKLEALAASDRQLTVVDVGCGEGDFIGLLRNVANVRTVGIDITAESVDACRRRGHEAYCTDLRQVRSFVSGPIDVITAFHALEHMDNPVDFVCTARDLLAPAGRLMISTPYSPMSLEENWFDPLNHPPHHITRWSEKPYKALADRTGMALTVIPGPVRALLPRTAYAFMLEVGITPTFGRGAIPALMGAALRHPVILVKQLLRQVRRRRLAGKPAPDVILVELTRTAPR